MKRGMDLALSAVGLLVAAPFVLAAMLAVRFSSEGPALFAQVRVGRNGAHFKCLKLRTMYVGTPSVPTHQAAPASVTPLGRHFRRFKIDELPQLWNVLAGEMSLVGPRPCLPTQSVLIDERRRRGVYALRPGITGLAQVRGIDMSDPVQLAATDAEYLRRASIPLDFKILWSTFFRGARPI